MTTNQLHILQHSLGVNQYGEGNQYRNRYIIGPESADDFAECQALVADGLMQDLGAQAMYGGMHYFQVTQKGREAMAANSPKRPDEIERLRNALEESVKLQSHYATLLNDYDGGERRGFKSADDWIARLDELNRTKK